MVGPIASRRSAYPTASPVKAIVTGLDQMMSSILHVDEQSSLPAMVHLPLKRALGSPPFSIWAL